jgi:hypothetical protein
VSPTEEVVWEGHPASLNDGIIEEHLKNVRLQPTFAFPRELKSIEKTLNAGNFGKGLKDLEKFLGDAKEETKGTAVRDEQGDDPAAAARKAIEEVRGYGKAKLQTADAYAKDGYYADALAMVETLEKSFKGDEISAQAKEKKEAWKKDPAVKAEIEAGAYLERASVLIREKKYKQARAILDQIIAARRFQETKAKKRAEERKKSLPAA